MYAKKNLFLVILFLSHIFLSAAQNCTPSLSYTQPGIYPDSVIGLPHAYAGTPYATVINIKVDSDTVYSGFTFIYDSVRIDSVKMMKGSAWVSPSVLGFGYSCNLPACTWPGGANGCIDLSGTPSLADSGVNPVRVYLTAYLHGVLGSTVQGVVRDDYKLVIEPPLGLYKIPSPEEKIVAISDPSSGNISIIISALRTREEHVKIYNLRGSLLYEERVSFLKGENKISIPSIIFPSGLYIFIDGETKHKFLICPQN